MVVKFRILVPYLAFILVMAFIYCFWKSTTVWIFLHFLSKVCGQIGAADMPIFFKSTQWENVPCCRQIVHTSKNGHQSQKKKQIWQKRDKFGPKREACHSFYFWYEKLKKFYHKMKMRSFAGLEMSDRGPRPTFQSFSWSFYFEESEFFVLKWTFF